MSTPPQFQEFRMTRIGYCLALVASLTVGALSAEAGCRTVGGSADMVTRDLAKFMAEAALKNAIAAHGLKPAGPMSMTCKDDTMTTNCKAFRRACS
jgi:uncharacterized membrane protein